VATLPAQPQGAPYDQMMVLYPPRMAGTDSLVRIYNNDGSEAGACGNGMRCVASLVTKETGKDWQGLTCITELTVRMGIRVDQQVFSISGSAAPRRNQLY